MARLAITPAASDAQLLMPQFDVYQNRNEATRGRFPLLLDVQSDLLQPLNTRVVVPLSPVVAAKTRSMQVLTPNISVAGKEYLMVTPQLAGISRHELGTIVDTVSSERTKIIAALDLLITGI
jgi:toxin CcdB